MTISRIISCMSYTPVPIYDLSQPSYRLAIIKIRFRPFAHPRFPSFLTRHVQSLIFCLSLCTAKPIYLQLQAVGFANSAVAFSRLLLGQLHPMPSLHSKASYLSSRDPHQRRPYYSAITAKLPHSTSLLYANEPSELMSGQYYISAGIYLHCSPELASRKPGGSSQPDPSFSAISSLQLLRFLPYWSCQPILSTDRPGRTLNRIQISCAHDCACPVLLLPPFSFAFYSLCTDEAHALTTNLASK
jgi:hypothetical protein